jgi:hypothetical protein
MVVVIETAGSLEVDRQPIGTALRRRVAPGSSWRLAAQAVPLLR